LRSLRVAATLGRLGPLAAGDGVDLPRAGAAREVVGESAFSAGASSGGPDVVRDTDRRGTGAAAAIGGKKALIPSGNTVNDGLCGRALGLACGLLPGAVHVKHTI
jgi:hypothetical protein